MLHLDCNQVPICDHRKVWYVRINLQAVLVTMFCMSRQDAHHLNQIQKQRLLKHGVTWFKVSTPW